MNLKNALSAVGKVLAGTAKNAVPLAGPILDSVFKTLDENKPTGTPQEQMAWEKMRGDLEVKREEMTTQLQQKLADADSEIYRAAQETMRQALSSSDAYVRRQTPTIGYGWLFILVTNYGFTHFVNLFFETSSRLQPWDLPFEFWLVGGALLGYRMHTRRKEKEKGVAS